MSETSKRNLKHDIIYGIPEFKTADEIVKFLSEGDVPRRKAELREWYLAGEGLHSLPPDQQETLFVKSPQYQQYLHDLAEVDRAVSKIADGLRASFDRFQTQFLDRTRRQLEERMQLVAGQEREAADVLGQYKDKLREVSEQGKRYDAELERVSRREEELKVLQSGLEQRSLKLTEKEKQLKVREEVAVKYAEREQQLKAREEALDKLELASGERARELAQALSDVAAFRKFSEERGKMLYESLEGFAQYLTDLVARRSGAKDAKPDDIALPRAKADETVLDLDISVAPPKQPQPPSK
jgi:chromosome segregation ATPase